LIGRTLAKSDDELRALNGVVGAELVVLLGPEEALPWVDGAGYLGLDPLAPALLLPTTLEPSVPADLFERALLAAHWASELGRPLAVLPDAGSIAALGGALPLARERLLAWVAR
jgi:hypothetical protein